MSAVREGNSTVPATNMTAKLCKVRRQVSALGDSEMGRINGVVVSPESV